MAPTFFRGPAASPRSECHPPHRPQAQSAGRATSRREQQVLGTSLPPRGGPEGAQSRASPETAPGTGRWTRGPGYQCTRPSPGWQPLQPSGGCCPGRPAGTAAAPPMPGPGTAGPAPSSSVGTSPGSVWLQGRGRHGRADGSSRTFRSEPFLLRSSEAALEASWLLPWSSLSSSSGTTSRHLRLFSSAPA